MKLRRVSLSLFLGFLLVLAACTSYRPAPPAAPAPETIPAPATPSAPTVPSTPTPEPSAPPPAAAPTVPSTSSAPAIPSTTIASPSLKIVSPVQGATLPAGAVTVTVEVTNFNVVSKLGQAAAPGEGHIHYYLDAEPPTTPGKPAITAAGSYTAEAGISYTWQNVVAGSHTLGVQLVNNNHTPLEPPVVAQVTVNVSGGQSVSVNISAQSFSFDKNTITVAPGASVTIIFTIRDSGYHNFAVYQNSSGTNAIFVGQAITGPATIEYKFTAPSTSGTYFFRCDVHPTIMYGSFVVGTGGSTSSGGSSGGGGGSDYDGSGY